MSRARFRAWYESDDILDDDFEMNENEEVTEDVAEEEETEVEPEVDVEETTEEMSGDTEDKELIDSIEDDETREYYQEGEENLAATEGLEDMEGDELDIEMEKTPEHSDDNWNIKFVDTVLEEADATISSLAKDLAEDHGDAIAAMVETPFVTSTDENGDVLVQSFDPDEMETNHTTLSKDVSSVGASEEDDYEEVEDDEYVEEAVGYDEEDEEF